MKNVWICSAPLNKDHFWAVFFWGLQVIILTKCARGWKDIGDKSHVWETPWCEILALSLTCARCAERPISTHGRFQPQPQCTIVVCCRGTDPFQRLFLRYPFLIFSGWSARDVASSVSHLSGLCRGTKAQDELRGVHGVPFYSIWYHCILLLTTDCNAHCSMLRTSTTKFGVSPWVLLEGQQRWITKLNFR